jgi:DNA-binding SARP family transcriptional activator
MEPGLRRGAVSKYIKRETDSYQLIIDDNLWIDFLEFLKFYWEGKDCIVRDNERGAIQAYERALRVCRRPFLSDSTLDLPVEVEVTRHRLQRFLHEMAWYLAQKSNEVGDWATSERALLKLLAVDPHDEAARDELVEIYRVQGKEGLAQELEGIGVE